MDIYPAAQGLPRLSLRYSPSRSGKIRAVVEALFAVCTWLAALPAQAQTTGNLTGIHAFQASDGSYANLGNALTLASDGNFYGLTNNGGTNSYGEVFRVSPSGDFAVIHSFNASAEGGYPYGKLLQASDGNFYGTTSFQGPASGFNGYGTIFRMTPDGATTVLHTFGGQGDGLSPHAGLIQGSDGNLYGTTNFGGASNGGTIFQISLAGKYRLMYSFAATALPTAPLVQGSDGNLYGVASAGSVNDPGFIYRMAPGGLVTTLHNLSASDGTGSYSSLVEASAGVFYGLTSFDGISNSGYGTAFKITSDGTFTVLHQFTGGNDGGTPVGGFVLAADGNLYATTSADATGYGNIIRCAPDGTITTVCNFKATRSVAGGAPQGSLTQAGDGSFYGTTGNGGSSGHGAVFRLTISDHPAFFNGQVDLGGGVDYLQFANGNLFGYYTFLSDPHYLYHYDLGFEYVFDLADAYSSVVFYDFTSGDFLYTSPVYPFPYLYDFNLKAVLYYYPDPINPGRYNTNGVRYFYNFSTGKIISR